MESWVCRTTIITFAVPLLESVWLGTALFIYDIGAQESDHASISNGDFVTGDETRVEIAHLLLTLSHEFAEDAGAHGLEVSRFF